MKKKCIVAISGFYEIWTLQFFRKMRTTVLVSLILVSQVMALGTYSQNTRLNLNMTDVSIRSVLGKIEDQSEFYFMYEAHKVDVERRVSIKAENRLVTEILNEIFGNTDIVYKIDNRQIALTNIAFNKENIQQDKTVRGIVTSSAGEPVPGVTVAVKGTTKGTITNVDGEYTLTNVTTGDMLVFSFVGLKTQEIIVRDQQNIDVIMAEEAVGIDEVVVTALGLKREKKALGYSVGEVHSDNMNRVPQQDLLGALSGKMSGVKITNTSNDINGDTYVDIRGITSLAGNNNPLVVVDGIPVGDQTVLKDISPDNIESVSVLKGPSAAALYGSRAGSGVVLVTSKSGKVNKKGIGVDVSLSTTFTKPYKYIDLQRRFTCGISGVLNESSYQQWNGPEEGEYAVQWNTEDEEELVFYDNSLTDYFETGIENVCDISVNGSYDRGNFRLGISLLEADGIYPGVELKRSGVDLSTMYKITDKVKVSTTINVAFPNSDNYPLKNGGNTQYMAIYQVPPHINVNDLKDYWETEDVLQRNFNTNHDNPWFAAYELKDGFTRLRVFGNIKLDYQILPELSVMGRFSYNTNNYKRTYRQPWSSYGGDGGGQSMSEGMYEENINNLRELNSDFLVSYKKKIGKFEIDPSVGGNIMIQRKNEMYAGGDPLVLAGLYTLSNVDRDGLTYYDEMYDKDIYSVYALCNLSYNNMLFLDLTARNDWSSTLPEDNRSYFYPSASLSALVNEMVTLPSWISLLKLRTGLSQVGKDTDPYVISTVLEQSTWGSNTQYSVPSSLPNLNLKPEIAKSFEIGTDVSFCNNRIGADFTYYTVKNTNQILDASTSAMSGYTAATINAGNVENRGVEIGIFATPIKTNDWKWDINANFTRERSYLKELSEGIDQYLFWQSTNVYSYTFIGDQIGDIWGYDMKRVEDESSEYYGWAILDSNGKLQKNTDEYIKLGNYMHDFMVGLQTTFAYKRFTVSMSFDWRQGGKYYDQTMMRLARAGKVEKFHDNKNSSTFTGILSNNSFNGDNSALAAELKAHPEIYQNDVWVGGRTADLGGFLYSNGVYEGAFFPGVISDGDGGYIENFGEDGTQYVKAYDIFQPSGGYWNTAVRNKWIYDASFVKLREMSVSYTLPESIAQKFFAQNIMVSAFVRNIVLYAGNKTNQDPESIYNQTSSTGVTRQGRSLWNASPIAMPIGFKLNLSF